jgi:hypothetical protein
MDALTTHDTGAVNKVFAQSGNYHGMTAAVFNAQGIYTLDYAASLDTTAAQYAFIGIPEQGRGRNIFGDSSNLIFKWVVPDYIFSCQALQFTIFIADTIQAVLGMMR